MKATSTIPNQISLKASKYPCCSCSEAPHSQRTNAFVTSLNPEDHDSDISQGTRATTESIGNDKTSTLPDRIHINAPVDVVMGFAFHSLVQPKPDNLMDVSAKLERQFREAIEPHINECARKEREGKIQQRKEYAYLIPLHKRYSALPLHDELKYQALARFQQMTPKERDAYWNVPLFEQCTEEILPTFTTNESPKQQHE